MVVCDLFVQVDLVSAVHIADREYVLLVDFLDDKLTICFWPNYFLLGLTLYNSCTFFFGV